MSEKIHHYINAEWFPATDDEYLEGINPATGEVIYQVPRGDSEAVIQAVFAAKDAFPRWSKLSIEERANWLMRLADAIEYKQDELAECETRDTGKPITLAKSVDMARASANLRYFAHAVTQFHSECYSMGERALNYTLRQPLGVVGAITPWNLPLYLLTWKIAPALATGNCVVAKPSELTSLTAHELAKICQEIGFPKGVLNIVYGAGETTGQALCSNAEVKAITFTGGTVTGKRIATELAPQFKKHALELGGKNPALIFADCNIELAVSECVRASFSNQGQICLCTSRIFVEESIYDQFVDLFVAATAKLKLGDPMDQNTQQGAIISQEHFNKIMSYVDLATNEGGEIILGGERVQLEGRCAKGHFILPTVITGLDPNCRTNQEEIFGPVTSIMPFNNEYQVLNWANDSDYGLAATIFTQSLSRAHRIAAQIHAGLIWVNCWMVRDLRTPFGGMKQSGLGREGGIEGLRFFTEPKNICVNIN